MMPPESDSTEGRRDDRRRGTRIWGWPDGPAHAARRTSAPAARGARGQPGGRRLGDPGLRVQDQPDGARPGQLQGARRRRPAHALRRRRHRRAGARCSRWPGEANTPGWWHRYGDVLPNWFQSYLGLEAAASLIRTYEVQFVPGLLQTRGVRAGGGAARPRPGRGRRRSTGGSSCGCARQTDARPAGGGPAVGGHRRGGAAPAGRRRGGDARADRGAHRGDPAPTVRLQVIPFEAGGHSAAGGAFTHPALPGPGTARHRLHRAADQRPLPGQARRRRAATSTRWSGCASRPTSRSARRTRCAGSSRTPEPVRADGSGIRPVDASGTIRRGLVLPTSSCRREGRRP